MDQRIRSSNSNAFDEVGRTGVKKITEGGHIDEKGKKR